MPPRRVILTIIVCFFALTFAVYGSSLTNEFVRWDDDLLITENPAVNEISPRSIAWVFTHYDPELYIPLTFLTYQFDHLIAGQHPFMYHFTNLILHTLNALLVFFFLYLLTSRKWPADRSEAHDSSQPSLRAGWVALFCGLLFAVHPLHTEAVVWASARKDVLSGFFFLVSITLYLFLLKGRSVVSDQRLATKKTYWLSIGAFFLGLLSKVSIIFLPFILILIDFYEGRKITKETLIQKIPYFLLSIFFGLVALYGKRDGLEGVTLLQTFLMAARSTVFYLQKLFVPTALSVLYPTGRGIELLFPEYFIPLFILLGIAATLFFFRKNRTIIFGALFFFLMILPSYQNFAKDGDYFFASDRYAYLGSIGVLFLVGSILFHGGGDFRHNYTIQLNSILSSAVVILFGVMAFLQSMVWRDSETLFNHTLRFYPNYNARVYNNLGNVYRRQERAEEAIAMFKKALEIHPHSRTYSNLGAVYRKEGRIVEALEAYRRAIEIDPEDAQSSFGLGLVYAQAGDYDKALEQYRAAIDHDPEYAEAYSNMGAIFFAAGESEQAIAMYREAIKADSLFVQAYFNLGVALARLGRTQEAIMAYEAAIEISPDLIPAHINLGILYYSKGMVREARNKFQEILKRDPGNPSAISALEQIGG